MEDVNKRRRIFLSLSKLECSPQEINPREYRCLHLKFSERLKKTRIHFKSDVFAAVAHPCGPVNGPQPRPQGFSLKKWEKPWAQLFEGRLALNPGLNLTWVSLSFVKKHFLRQFSLIFIEHRIINLLTKELNWIYFISFHIWIQILHLPWVILTQLWTTRPWGRGWMDPASPGGFRQTVLLVQSPQKSSCHSNIPTWGLASLRSWRYLLCFERVTAARKVNGGWNRKQWGRGRGEKAFFSLPSPLGPSSIVFLFVLISAFAHQLRRLERLIP